MTTRQNIELRRSEIRERLGSIATLEGDARTEAITAEQGGLMLELRASEGQLQAAIAAEEADPRLRNPGDGEGAEHRALVARCSLGDIFGASIEHRQTEGAVRELQEHLGLSGNQVPLDLLLEHRAVTPAPSDVGQNLAAIIPGVFPQSCAAFMGIDTPRVGVGEAVFPVLTTNAGPGTPAENDPQSETTGSFSAEVLSPGRIQASFFYSREDRARFMGMDASLRENLSMALADKLDSEILAGAEGLFTGTKLANHNVNAITSYANYRAQLAYGRVDGTYANDVKDLRIVMGSATYGHAAAQFRSANAGDRAALEDLQMVTGGVKVSAHVPAVNNDKQNCVIRLGMRRDMVTPIWEGVSLIPDEVTLAANGQIKITAIMLYAVKIIRQAGFYKQQTQHA